MNVDSLHEKTAHHTVKIFGRKGFGSVEPKDVGPITSFGDFLNKDIQVKTW